MNLIYLESLANLLKTIAIQIQEFFAFEQTLTSSYPHEFEFYLEIDYFNFMKIEVKLLCCL